jgi:RNA polymerase nonessential primary-like sigma factor
MPGKREVSEDEVVEEVKDLDAVDEAEDVNADDSDASDGDDTPSPETISESDAPTRRYAAGEIPDSQLDATRLYLNEIGFSKLLTAEEEVY